MDLDLAEKTTHSLRRSRKETDPTHRRAVGAASSPAPAHSPAAMASRFLAAAALVASAAALEEIGDARDLTFKVSRHAHGLARDDHTARSASIAGQRRQRPSRPATASRQLPAASC
jgi:hypothetical protein